MKKARKFRISRFEVGQDIHEACVAHFAPRTEGRAVEVFWREARKLRQHPGFVVLHQGNLKHDRAVILKQSNGWTRADELTVRHTAFQCYNDLLDAAGGYFPSLDVSDPENLELAEFYDETQQDRHDPRRAHRYGADRADQKAAAQPAAPQLCAMTP